MAVQFAQPYRFSEQQLARMVRAGVVPALDTALMEGVPYRAGAPHRFSSDDYFKLGEIGVFGERDRVELIDGEIIAMSPAGSPHSACIRRLLRFLSPRAGDALFSIQDTLFLPDEYRPMPDLVVLRPRADAYSDAHPTSDDALLVVEVSDSSLRYDRRIKGPRYAQAGIAEYWLVDVRRGRIFVHRTPAAGEYRRVEVLGRGESWTSDALGGLTIPVDEILLP
jgi:Uma2 family endonuclease